MGDPLKNLGQYTLPTGGKGNVANVGQTVDLVKGGIILFAVYKIVTLAWNWGQGKVAQVQGGKTAAPSGPKSSPAAGTAAAGWNVHQ